MALERSLSLLSLLLGQRDILSRVGRKDFHEMSNNFRRCLPIKSKVFTRMYFSTPKLSYKVFGPQRVWRGQTAVIDLERG